jgi:DNA-directed RNA polymerase subunit RPC12/RpoP
VPESAFGKKLKCKYCGEKFEVERVNIDDLDEDEPKKKPAGKVSKPTAVGTSKPGGTVKSKKEKEQPKPEAKPEAPAAPGPGAYKFADEDEDEGGATPNPLGVVDAGEDIPRCPHCAKELDPPDAVVCVHCGFNNLTRVKAESKKTWAPSGGDWFNHLTPGVLALLGWIFLIVLDVVVYLSMDDWLAGTFMEDTPGKAATATEPAVKARFYARINDACILFTFAATIMPIIKLARFSIIRLLIKNTPEEKVKT